MSKVEYLVTFLTFILGLGVADLFSNLIKLLKEGSRVRWYWLSVLWTITAFLGLISAWFAYWYLLDSEIAFTGWGFLLAISPAIFIFAFTVSILPHHFNSDVIDLKLYFFNQHKLIFTLASLDLLFRMITQYVFGKELIDQTFWILLFVLFLLLVLSIFTKNKLYHAFMGILCFLFYLNLSLNNLIA